MKTPLIRSAARITKPKLTTLADVLARVGDVPPERVLLSPPPGTATIADLKNHEITEGRLCELVYGILVEKTMGFREAFLATRILTIINQFLLKHNIGCVVGADGMIRFKINVVRLPDVSFIRWDSVDDPEDIVKPKGACLEYPPDLVVEVLSPGNSKKEMDLKLAEYAKAGVRIVWYVDPKREEVDIYPNGNELDKTTVGMDGVLDGGTVVPGFTLPVAKIFECPYPEKKSGSRPKRKRK